MAKRHSGPGGYSLYTTPVPEGQERRPSAFGKWDGYGGFGGFIDSQEPRTPEYQEAIDTVADSLTRQDFQDPRYLQVVKDMADTHGIGHNDAWWDLQDDPEAHAKSWKPDHSTYDGQIPYNWAYTSEDPFDDQPATNELQRNMTEQGKPPQRLNQPGAEPMRLRIQPDTNPPGPQDRQGPDAADLDWIKRYVGQRTSWVPDPPEPGRPLMPSEHARPGYDPDGHPDRPYRPDHSWVWERNTDDMAPPMPSDHAEHRRPPRSQEQAPTLSPSALGPDDLTRRLRGRGVLTAREQAAMLSPWRTALQGPPSDLPAPSVDWDPVMQGIEDTGGYTIGQGADDGPSSGYMVSLPGTEERRPTETVTPHTEGDYHKRHWDQLNDDPDLYQGGWDDDGTFYTDLSRNDEDLYRTVGDAVATDQLGIYDLNRGQTLDTYDNPDDDRDDYNPLLVSPSPVVAFGSVHTAGGFPCPECGADTDGHGTFAECPWCGWKDDGENDPSFEKPGPEFWDKVDRTLGRGRESARVAGPLQYQDQHDEAQYPSPPGRHKQRDKRKQRAIEKKFKQPKEMFDPNMLDDRIDVDSLVANALSRYRGATPEQMQSGRDWYSTARKQLQGLVQATGGDFSKAAAIMAALSPQMDWEGNLNAGAHFLNSYDPANKSQWRNPNISPDALAKWREVAGDRAPESDEEWAALSNLAGVDDPDWAKELAADGRWDEAVGRSGRGRYRGPFTGTGLPTLGDNVLRAMKVYESDDPREIMQYAGGPKIHSFWRNFLGDEDYATIDKHMLRALDRGFGEDPLMSYGSGKPEVTREVSDEDRRVNELEKMLSYTRTMKGDEQVSVPTGYNSYVEAIRRATSEANKERGADDQLTPAQMQAIIWVQHKGDMDNFAKRKSQEAWDARNPGKAKPAPKPYVPAYPIQPTPDYTRPNSWHEENPYKGGEPRPLRKRRQGPNMSPDNIPDVDVEPDMTYVNTPEMLGEEQEMARAASFRQAMREFEASLR